METLRLVVDSCMLQSSVLRQYLGMSKENYAVLPDFIWLELYKQKSIDAVSMAVSVVGSFPEQVIVLKSGKEIASLDVHQEDLTSSMERPDVERDIREMTAILNGPDLGDPCTRAQLERLWCQATDERAGMLEGAADILASLPEMAEQMFTPQQVRIIRTDARYTAEMFSSVFGAADQIWEALSGSKAKFASNRTYVLRNRAYLYRYSLAIVVYLLWWIKNGSQPQARLDRTSNDFIDLSFGVYGTYYDGLMTSDKKAKWMHQNLCLALHAVGAEVPAMRHLRP